ncbi:hypothetical protein BGZ94_006778 [Podila epigama]|nr:hypothetical protein BGZ94_006778 [Podila epigama]
MNQPRTSTSNGRPSFSLLRGRKNNHAQRGDLDDQTSPYGRHPILHISAPIIEPSPPTGDDTLLYTTTEPGHAPAPRKQRSRSSMDAIRPHRSLQQLHQHYIEPPRSTSGAYKAKFPPLPISAQTASSSNHSSSAGTPIQLDTMSSFPPPPVTATPPPPGATPIFPSTPQQHSHLEDSQRLWRDSLRNAAEERRNEPGLTRSSSNNSLASSSRQSYTSSFKDQRRNKPLSGSTFATTLSPSSSNASQSSFRPHRKRSGKLSEEWGLGLSENSSVLSLPGSRYIGHGNSALSDDDGYSTNSARHIATGSSHVAISTASSLTGVNSVNDRYDSQFSTNVCHANSLSQPASPQRQRWSPTTAVHNKDGGISDTGFPTSPLRAHWSKRTSARESMSSINTANYQWMDEQSENRGDRDVLNRESMMMLLNSSTSADNSLSDKDSFPDTLTSEQIAQQHLEQQMQQHALLKYFFKGNYHAPFDKQTLGAVLDVGCGTGLWMKDMALEFPLTEVHGVDLVVPTRRRRLRTNNALGISTPSLSSLSGSATDLNKSTTAAPSLSIMDSIPSNCFFHKADITEGLPFADNSFDYCHVQLVLWGYQLNAFPNLLEELIRVTKKGGWIEFVDMDPCLKKTTDTGTRINEWTGLIHNNMDPDLVKTLPKFLKEYCEASLPREPKTPSARDSDLLQTFGLDNLKISKVSLPFGPWGGKIGELWQHSLVTFLKDLEPTMIDATLSGLIMDQYHRQCLDEMQQMAEEASRQSGSSGKGERITSFDQRLCTHKAWSRLIQQLIADASLSHPPPSGSLGIASTATSSKTAPSSPSMDAPQSSIKEMRSYNNFFIMYAQKVDLMELKQQILLHKLEQEIFSPNQGTTPITTFASQAPKLWDSTHDHGALAHDVQQTGSLFDKLLLTETRHQPSLHLGENTTDESQPNMVTSLTEDALETFNKNNGSTSTNTSHGVNGNKGSNVDGDAMLSNLVSPGSTVPPTPTSVAALSIRSSSRMSNNNSATGQGKYQSSIPGTPGSLSSANGCLSPRGEATVNRAMSYIRRKGSAKSLGSPQPAAQEGGPSALSGDADLGQSFVPDYFNQGGSIETFSNSNGSPTSYHHQQYNHHYQQQMNVIKRKPSLLNQVLSSPVESQILKDHASSDRTVSSTVPSGDADGFVILISLEDGDEVESDAGSTSGDIPTDKDTVGDGKDGDTIEILNFVSDQANGEELGKSLSHESSQEAEDDRPLQMLVLDDDEVFVMLDPEMHHVPAGAEAKAETEEAEEANAEESKAEEEKTADLTVMAADPVPIKLEKDEAEEDKEEADNADKENRSVDNVVDNVVDGKDDLENGGLEAAVHQLSNSDGLEAKEPLLVSRQEERSMFEEEDHGVGQGKLSALDLVEDNDRAEEESQDELASLNGPVNLSSSAAPVEFVADDPTIDDDNHIVYTPEVESIATDNSMTQTTSQDATSNNKKPKSKNGRKH